MATVTATGIGKLLNKRQADKAKKKALKGKPFVFLLCLM